MLLAGAWMTVKLTLLGFLLAICIGLPIATARLYGPAPLRWLATVYVEFFRGIPVLLLLFFLYYSLPEVGGMLGLPANLLKLDAFLVGVIGFGLNYGAYESEIYRAGIASIPVGQWEAAASLGMSPLRIFFRIILPQAIKVILPPMTNDLVALFKDTSVVSVIAVSELMKQYQTMANDHLQYVEIGLMTILPLPAHVGAPGPVVALPRTPLGERTINAMHVEISNVTKRFGDRTVLDDISLRIEAGQTVALIGPSGAGKSTLLRCINGLNTFDGGTIRVGDHVLEPNRNHQACPGARQVRRVFGMIFQDFQLFPHLTALQNIMEAPRAVLKMTKTAAQDRALRLLARVGLEDRAQAYPSELSGGQKQRVAIARAMAMEPRGLLCDEITSALDPELKNEVLVVLESLKREGLTLILVTHEIGFARRAADRVVVLAGGKIIEDGPPQQVIDNPQAPRTQQFLKQMMV